MTPFKTPLPRLAGAMTGLMLLSACAAGPNYKGPPDTASLTSPGQFHRAPAAPVTADPPPARWWLSLNDAELTKLIDQTLQASPTLHEAQARLREARASLSQQRIKLAPTGGASALALNVRVPGDPLAGLAGAQPSGSGAGASDLTLYSVGFDATWELDLFGGVRRGIEAQSAQAQASEADLADTQVELAAEVAQTYVNLRAAQHQMGLLRTAREVEQRMLDLTLQRRASGTATDADVEHMQSQIDQTDGDMTAMTSQVEQAEDALAVLTGAAPGALDAELAAPGALPAPPAETPVGDPAAMLRRRPDIRAAERRLAASNAEIGVNVAQLFPQVTLLGAIGVGGTDASTLFNANKFSALGAPQLSWNILNYPRIHAQIRGAEAGRDEAEARYRATVLSALQDAESSLSRFGHQRDDVAALTKARTSADRTAALTRQRYDAGTASLIDSLQADGQRLEAENDLIQADAALTTDYIALQKSLGLGWSDTAQTAAGQR